MFRFIIQLRFHLHAFYIGMHLLTTRVIPVSGRTVKPAVFNGLMLTLVQPFSPSKTGRTSKQVIYNSLKSPRAVLNLLPLSPSHTPMGQLTLQVWLRLGQLLLCEPDIHPDRHHVAFMAFTLCYGRRRQLRC